MVTFDELNGAIGIVVGRVSIDWTNFFTVLNDGLVYVILA